MHMWLVLLLLRISPRAVYDVCRRSVCALWLHCFSFRVCLPAYFWIIVGYGLPPGEKRKRKEEVQQQPRTAAGETPTDLLRLPTNTTLAPLKRSLVICCLSP
ncbi:unnamed protein product, partial [Ectocarpus sp. 12 AP-2014]